MPDEVFREAARQLQICNACRYCEGYCAVWEALDRRNEVKRTDVLYLSSLCHDCRQCFNVCPFTEPHEYNLDIPRALSTVRYESYTGDVWPEFMKEAFRRPYLYTSAIFFVSLFSMLLLSLLTKGNILAGYTLVQIVSPAEYRVVTLAIYIYVIFLWGVEGYRYWSEINAEDRTRPGLISVVGGLADAFGHENFKGGGAGCTYPNGRTSNFRLFFHPLIIFGFIIALASISFYPSFGLVLRILYLFGSAMMMLGTAGLLNGKRLSIRSREYSGMRKIDLPFTALLFFSGLTGVLLVAFYPYGFDWAIFLVHDAAIFTLFLLAPFGKFIHPVFRILALIKNRQERIEEELVMKT